MKCSEDFIKTYAKVLKLIDRNDGDELYQDFCKNIASLFVSDLEEKIVKEGIAGAYTYWKEVLVAEGANPSFTISKDGTLIVSMPECPSLRKLGLNNKNSFYCKHCHLIYPPIFNRRGYRCKIERKGDYGCEIVVSKR